MALTTTKADLMRYIGRKLGYGRSGVSGTKLTDVTDVLNDALRRFYEPDILPGEREKHQWSFLYPVKRFEFAETKWKYNLPQDFSMLNGPIFYARGEDTTYPALEITGPEKIYARQQQDDSAGRPRLAAVQVKSPDQASPTSYELIVYPTSDDDYEVNLRYKINPYSLDDTYALPLGGQAHVQTVLAACLAEAAAFDELESDKYEVRFIERLRASISHDRKLSAPETLGINYDTSDATDYYDSAPVTRWQSWGNLTTYNGSVPSG
jgi:hypothetical protein